MSVSCFETAIFDRTGSHYILVERIEPDQVIIVLFDIKFTFLHLLSNTTHLYIPEACKNIIVFPIPFHVHSYSSGTFHRAIATTNRPLFSPKSAVVHFVRSSRPKTSAFAVSPGPYAHSTSAHP